MPEVFRPKVEAIEERKDIDQIKIQELVGSIQTYEMGLPSHNEGKFIALKSVEELKVWNSNETDIEKKVASCKEFQNFSKI